MKSIFDRANSLVGKTSLLNFIHLSLNQGTNVIVALIITPFLFQTLGEEQYGLVSLGLTIVLLFGMLVNYGFNLNIPKKLALLGGDKKATEALLNEVVITRILLCLVMIFALLLSLSYLNLFEGYSIIIIFSMVQLLNDALFPMFILQGFDRLSWISKANFISKLIYLGLIILIIKSPQDAKWVNFVLGSTGAAVHGILLFLIYKKEGFSFYWVGFTRVKALLVDNFHFFSSTIAAYILINGGFILLRNFVSDAELGFYALAQRVAILLRMVPVFLTQSILQNATRLYKQDRVKFETYLNRAYLNGLLVTFSIGILLAVSATWVVRILAGEFIPISADLMRILGFLPFLGMLNVKNMIKILVAERKHILATAIWSTTILMLVMATIGAYYWGSYGLAFALIVAEIFNFWIHLFLLKRAADHSPPNEAR